MIGKKNRTGERKPLAKGGTRWYWNWLSKQIYMAVAAVGVTVFALFSLLDAITRHNKELEVPDFTGMGVEEALEVADANTMRLEITDSVHIPRMVPGSIYKQNPIAGSKVKKNRRILLTINAKSPKMVAMPSLVGYSLRQAQSELASSQLKVGKLIYVPDIATNNVLGQLYKGRPVAPGVELPSESAIDLEVGQNGADSVTFVPELTGKPYSIIKDYLIDNSLNLGNVYFDSTVSTYQDSLAAFAYRQEPAHKVEVADSNGLDGEGNGVARVTATAKLGTPVTVYFTLDKTLIPNNEPKN